MSIIYSIIYSSSCLVKEDREIRICSTFHHCGGFFSYVVVITTKIGEAYERTERSFSKIDKAEGFHMDTVLKLAYDEGFTIKFSSCK